MASGNSSFFTTCREPTSIKLRKGGSSASLAITISPCCGSYASSSARFLPPVEIVAMMDPVGTSTTRTRLSPSPTHSSRRETGTMPFGPEVSLLPVNPLKPVICLTTAFSVVSTTSTAELERSAR